MNAFKIIWGAIVIIWLIILNGEVTASVDQVESAMQASQLYNQATVTILGIIAVTLAINLRMDPFENPSQKFGEMAKGLAEQSKRITDMLDRFDQHLERSGSSNVSIPTTANKIESINSVLSSQLEDPESIPSHNRLCSKCNSPMNIRTATKGEHLGEQFYVCSNYPNCQEVLPV